MDQKPGMYQCWKEAAIVAGRILLAYAIVIGAVLVLLGLWRLMEGIYR